MYGDQAGWETASSLPNVKSTNNNNENNRKRRKEGKKYLNTWSVILPANKMILPEKVLGEVWFYLKIPFNI